MRVLFALTAVFALSQVLSAADANDQPKGLEQLRGSWKVIAKSDPEFEPTRLIFDGDLLTVAFGAPEDTEKASIKIDRDAEPAEIDITSHRNGKTAFGVYRVKCDVLQICLSKSASRPTKFEEETGVILVKLQRE